MSDAPEDPMAEPAAALSELSPEEIALAIANATAWKSQIHPTDDGFGFVVRALLQQTAEVEALRRDLASYMEIANAEAALVESAEQRASALAARLAEVEAALRAHVDKWKHTGKVDDLIAALTQPEDKRHGG